MAVPTYNSRPFSAYLLAWENGSRSPFCKNTIKAFSDNIGKMCFWFTSIKR